MGKLIAFATLEEAREVINNWATKEVKKGKLFSCSFGYILITGIGSLSACQAITQHADLATELLNFGLAGSLKPELVPGETFFIASIAKHLSIPTCCDEHAHRFSSKAHPVICLKEQGLCLVSSDYPVNHSEVQFKLAKSYDLVDMEGYGIAFACQELGLGLRIWKTVSDFANPKSSVEIKQRMAMLSKVMAAKLEEIL